MDNIFFLASKFGWALLSPSNLIIFGLILGFIFLTFKRQSAAKFFLFPAALLGLTVMIYPVGDYLIEPLEQRFNKPESLPNGIDGIIVLGGGEDLKTALSWKEPEIGPAGDRYIATAHLARNYPGIPILFTGGSGSLSLQGIDSDGTLPKTILTMVGVYKERLVIESESRNTYENFKFTKPLLPKQDGTYLLVTSAFHMPRSIGIARQQGVNVVPYPVDYRSSSEKYRNFGISFLGHIDTLEIAWKEWIGLTAYYLGDKTDEWFPNQVEKSK